MYKAPTMCWALSQAWSNEQKSPSLYQAAHKSMWYRCRQIDLSCVTVGKLFNLFKPRLSYL